jgi:hypothetical protein
MEPQMAVTVAVTIGTRGEQVAIWTSDAAGGNGPGVAFASFPIKTVQRTTGAGTSTVEGSNDNITFGALGAGVATVAGECTAIPENPRFIRIVASAAAGTYTIVGV